MSNPLLLFRFDMLLPSEKIKVPVAAIIKPFTKVGCKVTCVISSQKNTHKPLMPIKAPRQMLKLGRTRKKIKLFKMLKKLTPENTTAITPETR